MRTLLIMMLLSIYIQSNAQEFLVNLDDRNKAIDLTSQAKERIDEGNPIQAISILSEALMVDSTYRETYRTLYKASISSNIYSSLIIDNLKKGIKIYNDDDELSFFLGEVYRMNNDLDSALKHYTFSIKLSKINGEDFNLVYLYYFNRGNCYLKLGQIKLAIEDYDYSLKLKPENPNVYTNRGTCFYKLGESQKACEDWSRASELGSNISFQYLKNFCK